jgi:hypothetical protein
VTNTALADIGAAGVQMTYTTNARIAGFTFLLYIGVGIGSMVLFSQATGGQEVTAKLASIAQHLLQLRLTILLGLLQAVCAIVLAVTLYAITRNQDSELAMLALSLRVGEGLLGAISTRERWNCSGSVRQPDRRCRTL